MKNTNKGFTLVELIVVITILAILGTIAFISLQGYSQDAKNAKVGSDLATLASAIEIGLTDGKLSGVSTLVDTNNLTPDNKVAATATVTTYSNNIINTGSLLDDTQVNYNVGNVDFAALRQNGDDFKDPEGNKYLVAVAYTGSTAYYQLAGQKKENSGDYTLVLKGNYVKQDGNTDSLISDVTTNTTARLNAYSSGSSILY